MVDHYLVWDAVTKIHQSAGCLELSEMYAWTVDFFGCSPGDHFTVVMMSCMWTPFPIGLGRIHAASLITCGKECLPSRLCRTVFERILMPMETA